MTTVWFTDVGPEGGLEVQVGSEEHKQLLKAGHVPDGAEDSLSSLKVGELRDLADEHDVDVPADAKKADLVQALEEAGVTPTGTLGE